MITLKNILLATTCQHVKRCGPCGHVGLDLSLESFINN